MTRQPQQYQWLTSRTHPRTVEDGPNVKPETGSVVALRVVARGNLIVATVDGVQVKKLRAQMPMGNLKFGLYVQVDAAAPDATFEIKRYKVTSGG